MFFFVTENLANLRKVFLVGFFYFCRTIIGNLKSGLIGGEDFVGVEKGFQNTLASASVELFCLVIDWMFYRLSYTEIEMQFEKSG